MDMDNDTNMLICKFSKIYETINDRGILID